MLTISGSLVFSVSSWEKPGIITGSCYCCSLLKCFLQPVTVALEIIIKRYFPEEYTIRDEQYRSELRQLAGFGL